MGDIYWVTIYGRKKAGKSSGFKKKKDSAKQNPLREAEEKKTGGF